MVILREEIYVKEKKWLDEKLIGYRGMDREYVDVILGFD